jgi:hypothetical protein
MRAVFGGRRVVLAGGVAAMWTEHLDLLRTMGATDVLVVATEGRGAGPQPDVRTVIVEPPAGTGFMERIHAGNATLADPPDEVLAALEAFDPSGTALVVGSFLNVVPALAGRPFLAHRRPEWLALEDKVVIDDFWDRAGIRRLPSIVVPVAEASATASSVDRGDGTVWAADAREGFHGGATRTFRVADGASRERAVAALTPVCDRVRIMPFLDGIPCSVHGMVLPDGVAVFRPVEMVTLRRGTDFVYAGCATFWDPPESTREEMRAVARRVGARLAAEVAFRGAFTVDGVVTVDGFRPTELNPRFGAGLTVVARASGWPITMLHTLVAGGRDIGRMAPDLEGELTRIADDHRGGGTWTSGLPNVPRIDARPLTLGADGWQWAAADGRPAATVTAGEGFLRCTYDPAAVPTGPSTAPLASAFWAFADRELGLGLGTLAPAPDLRPR